MTDTKSQVTKHDLFLVRIYLIFASSEWVGIDNEEIIILFQLFRFVFSSKKNQLAQMPVVYSARKVAIMGVNI